MAERILCFKAYDVRGHVPSELNPKIAYRIANATADFLSAETIVLGHDIRLTSREIADAVADGLRDAGVEVLEIGLCGTEMVYFSTALLDASGGIMVTASHNPADHNGLKIVREQAKPISSDTGLAEIRALAESDSRRKVDARGRRRSIDIQERYIEHLLSYIDISNLKPLKIVVNPGNGGAGVVMSYLESHLPLQIEKINFEPDGTFPNGVPNPMLKENQSVTGDAVMRHGADMGVAWDGDFDRCFLFDEMGRFIEGYYIVGLLAACMLEKNPRGKIIHDPRLVWNTQDIVAQCGGEAVQSKSGHSFIKEEMRRVDAVYGGEMSAHHYFRDFSYADSGMIPWLLISELMSLSGKSLSEMVDERQKMFPVSGEINCSVKDAAVTLRSLYEHFHHDAIGIEDIDGFSFEFVDWRFNIRMSNTEPVVRLNVESRGNSSLVDAKTTEILSVIQSQD